MAIRMYRVAHSDVPYKICKMFCLVSGVHKYSTRQSSDYYINSTTTKLKRETFKIGMKLITWLNPRTLYISLKGISKNPF